VARHIESIHVEGFRCLKDVEFELTDLHAFVGPNDSGKTTLLEAIRTLVYAATHNQMSGLEHRSRVRFSGGLEATARRGRVGTLAHSGGAAEWTMLDHLKANIPLVRLDPDELRKPTKLIRSSHANVWFTSERGLGLPAVYDALLNREMAAYLSIQSEVVKLFPTVAQVILETPDESTKSLAVKLRDGTLVGTKHLSEGLLYYLAFAAMQHLGPTPLLLVEEPENGLHPARIADVVRVLREIAKKSQVVIATHSPLLINELEPDEVSVVTRTAEAGTKVTPLKDTPNFTKRSSVFELGELWVAYADGVEEAPLLEGTEPDFARGNGSP
jgi:predicted ATPase